MDQHRNTDNLSSTNSPQLPDLLNGTEINKERQEIDKLNILKGLGEFNQVNSLQGYNNTSTGEIIISKLSCCLLLNKILIFRKLGRFQIRNVKK